jgi:hypothetical protein
MANIRIKDLPQYSPSPSSWLAAEVMTSPGIFTTSKAHLSTIVGTSSNANIWTSTTNTVSTLSSNWQAAYTQFNINNYTKLRSCYNSMSGLSGDWEATRIVVDTQESLWTNAGVIAPRMFTVMGPNSANWNNVYTTVRPNSANWNNVYTTVRPNSANWNNVYTYVRQASGDNGLARRYAVSVGNNSSASFDLPHNFNTTDVVVDVYTIATGASFAPQSILRIDVNTVRVTFSSIPTTNQYRVVILG